MKFARSPLLAAAVSTGFLAAGCAPIGPPPGTPTTEPPASSAPATDEPAAQAARDRYILQALTPGVPPALRGKRLYGEGTGFYVARDLVLTNFHVAGDCAVATVGNGSEGEEALATLVAGDAQRDLAVLRTVGTVSEPARFETRLYTETGDGLATVGYPEHGLAVREAELHRATALATELAAERPRFAFKGEVRRGNSGSPLLDDSGAVIGVVTAKIDTVTVYQRTGQVVDNIGFAISNRAVFDFLRASGIEPLPALPGPSLSPERLLDKAHGFVRQIGCWR